MFCRYVLVQKEGEFNVLHKQKKKILTGLILITVGLFILTAGCVQQPEQTVYPEITPEMVTLLDDYVALQKSAEENASLVLQSAAEKLGVLPYGSDKEREILRDVYAEIPNSVAVSFYNAKTVEFIYVPWSTNVFSADDIAVSESEKDGILLHGPFNSEIYSQLVAASYPVYAQDGGYIGRIAVYFGASELFNPPVKELPGAGTYSISALKEDGTFIYAAHSALTGTNINDRKGTFVRDTDTSGKYYTQTVNVVTHETVAYSAVWKTATVFGREITYLIGTTDNGETDYAAYAAETKASDELAAYVYQIYFYADHHTQEETEAYIRTLEPLSEKSTYPAFVGTFDSKITVMSQHPGYDGIDTSKITDSYTKSVFAEMDLRALQGGGYVYFYVDDKLTAAPEKALLQIAYIIPVGRDYFVGASIPAKTTVSEIDQTALDTIQVGMSDILTYYYANGKEKTLTATTENTILPETDLNIRAVSYDGISLANNKHPEHVGKLVLGEKDLYNNSPVREALILANAGGGLMYRWDEGENGTSTISLCLVVPMEGSWFISVSKPIETIYPEDTLPSGGGVNAS